MKVEEQNHETRSSGTRFCLSPVESRKDVGQEETVGINKANPNQVEADVDRRFQVSSREKLRPPPPALDEII